MVQRVALVTGASRGIGKAIALQLAQAGHRVIGTATSEAGAQAISAYFQAAGLSGEGRKLNVTEPSDIDSLIEAVQKEQGPIAILVNNAGITRDTLLMRMKDEDWQAIIDTNLTSVFRVSKACLRSMMKERFGRIITIGSVVGSTGNAGQANYCAAKAGLVGFSKALAKEVGSRGITVNVVAPGFIDTDMTKDLPEAHKETLLAQIPAGRLGQPDEIAAAVTFLASEAAGYISGETLHVNGGMFMS